MSQYHQLMGALGETGFVQRILGIDNGTNTVGFALLECNVRTGHVTVIDAFTLEAKKISHRYGDLFVNHDELHCRMLGISDTLRDVLHHYNPDVVCVESPFDYPGRADAFAKLSVVLSHLRFTVYAFDPLITFTTVTPMEAKKAVGAGTYIGGKEPIRDAVSRLHDVTYANGVCTSVLDEHGIDAIAVGYTESRRSLIRGPKNGIPGNSPGVICKKSSRN